MLAPLTKRKHVTLEKTKSYKTWFFPYALWVLYQQHYLSLTWLPLPLWERFFGVDGGWTRLRVLCWGRRHLLQLGWLCSLPPHSSSQLRSPTLVLGFWWQFYFIWLIFCSLSECNLLIDGAKKCHGCPQEEREHGQGVAGCGSSTGPARQQDKP